MIVSKSNAHNHIAHVEFEVAIVHSFITKKSSLAFYEFRLNWFRLFCFCSFQNSSQKTERLKFIYICFAVGRTIFFFTFFFCCSLHSTCLTIIHNDRSSENHIYRVSAQAHTHLFVVVVGSSSVAIVEKIACSVTC